MSSIIFKVSIDEIFIKKIENKYNKNNFIIEDFHALYHTGVLNIIKKIFQTNKIIIFAIQDFKSERKVFFIRAFKLFAPFKRVLLIDAQLTAAEVSLIKLLTSETCKFIYEYFSSLFFVQTIKKDIKQRQKIKAVVNNDAFKKIAYLRTDLTLNLKAGGSVGHIAGVANAFYDLGCQLFFISSDKLPLINEKQTKLNKLLPPDKYNNILNLPEIYYNQVFNEKAIEIFNQEKPNLIYQRYSIYNYSGVVLSQKFSIPLVIEYNGSEVWMAKHWGGKLKYQKMAEDIEMLNLNKARLIVVVSQPMKDELMKRGIFENKILVNPNGIDPKKFNPQISGQEVRNKYNLHNKIVVGFIGTFGPWHGIEILTRSIKKIIEKNKNIHFLLIGDGSLFRKVQEIINQEKIKEYVTLTGIIPQAEAPKYLAACDIYASPHVPNADGSPFFGSPTKLFEYMAMCKGIVASNLDQIGEVLKDNHSALLVTPGNIDDLAKKILLLAADEKLRIKLGKNALQEVLNNYTWNKNAQNIIDKLSVM